MDKPQYTYASKSMAGTGDHTMSRVLAVGRRFAMIGSKRIVAANEPCLHAQRCGAAA